MTEHEDGTPTVQVSAFLIARDLVRASIPIKYLRPYGKKEVKGEDGVIRKFDYDYDFKVAVTAVSIARGIERQLAREDERDRLDALDSLDSADADGAL